MAIPGVIYTLYASMFIIETVEGTQNYCKIVHALFDLNIVSDSKPGAKSLYHYDVINKLMKSNVFTEKELREIKQNNTERFLNIPILSGKEPTEQEINQCYLTTKESEERCKYARIFQISKLFYHDVVNLYRYYKLGHKIKNSFDLFAHWVELADFYILHPDVTVLCGQPNITNCGAPYYQPSEKNNYRLVFRPLCYTRVNIDDEKIPLKMEPPDIYQVLYRNETHSILQDRWYRLTVTFDETNGLREEVKRICLLKVESDFCFIEPMVKIYSRYLDYKNGRVKSDICRKLIMFSFEDLVLAETRPKLIDFWVNEFKPGGSTKNSEFEFINDIFPPLFEFIRISKKEQISKAMKCLVYPLKFMNSCSSYDNMEEKKCMFGHAVNVIFGYMDAVKKTNLSIIDTSIKIKEYISSFRLDTLLNNIETKTQKLQKVPYNDKRGIQESLHEHLKSLKKMFITMAVFNDKKMTRNVKDLENRMDDYIVSANEDSQGAAEVFDILINTAVVIFSYDTQRKKVHWGTTIVEALNPMAKISRKSPTEIFDSLLDIAKQIKTIDVGKELEDLILNLTYTVHHTKLGFFKNNDLIRFIKSTVHHSTNTNIDPDFARRKSLFVKNYEEYKPWITKDQLTSISSLWRSVLESSCNLINQARHLGIPLNAVSVFEAFEQGRKTCETAEVDIERMLQTLKETSDFQYELLQTFSSYIQAKETYFTVTSLSKHVDKPIRSDWFQTYFLSLYSRLVIYFEQLVAIEMVCERREYKEFGIRPTDCDRFPSSIEVSNLIHTDKSYCPAKPVYVRIPISPGPKKQNDNGFFNLGELFMGNKTSFQVPDDAWLVRNKWISEPSKYPIYIRDFQLFLPVVSENKTSVFVRGKLAGNNVLHPGDTKQFVIRPTLELDSFYTEGRTAIKDCKHLLENPYRTCPKPGWDLPKICFSDSEESDATNAFGSVYATWKFTVSGYEHFDVPVPAFTNDTFIQASVRLCVKTQDGGIENKSKEKYSIEKRIKLNEYFPNDKRSLSDFKNCCLQGYYFSQSEEKCKSCPDGYQRELKGYYCRKDTF